MDPEFSQRYRELYESHWWFRAREELIIKFLRRKQPPEGWGTILDVGCGDGLFFRELAQFGDVEGIELAGDVISPNNPFRNRIHIGPFDETFQPGKKYSLILMLDVLEHLSEPVAALRNAVSLLQPGGSLLITVPAFRALWTSHDELNYHFTRYTKASFGEVAEQAGLKTAESRYLFYWLFLAKLAVRAKESLFGSRPSIPGIPASGVNRLLFWVSRMEDEILGGLPIPLGSSLLVFGGASANGKGR
jgi:SAM-dependent methyltransferase